MTFTILKQKSCKFIKQGLKVFANNQSNICRDFIFLVSFCISFVFIYFLFAHYPNLFFKFFFRYSPTSFRHIYCCSQFLFLFIYCLLFLVFLLFCLFFFFSFPPTVWVDIYKTINFFFSFQLYHQTTTPTSTFLPHPIGKIFNRSLQMQHAHIHPSLSSNTCPPSPSSLLPPPPPTSSSDIGKEIQGNIFR